jgi:hypothetical protein
MLARALHLNPSSPLRCLSSAQQVNPMFAPATASPVLSKRLRMWMGTAAAAQKRLLRERW